MMSKYCTPPINALLLTETKIEIEIDCVCCSLFPLVWLNVMTATTKKGHFRLFCSTEKKFRFNKVLL